MQEAQNYTILVEAKDHGEKMQLSSTSTVILNLIDKHDHPSEFIRKTVSKQSVNLFTSSELSDVAISAEFFGNTLF